MTLLAAFMEIVGGWGPVFPRERSSLRAMRQGLGSLICLGRRTLTRIIWTNGGQHRSSGAEYFLHARCRWEPQQLFAPNLKWALPFCKGRYIGVAADDTRFHKTGRCIRQAFFQRDPLSPPFHVNLMLGLRFLQASLLVPLYRRSKVGCRALPIRFQEASRVKRPGRKAFGAERGEAYAPLPRWRRNAKRPSCLDLIALLRKEVVEHPELTAQLKLQSTFERQTAAAAA